MPTAITDRVRTGDGAVPVVDSDLHVYPPEERVLESFLPDRFRGTGLSYPDGNWTSPVGRFREEVDPGDPTATASGYLDRLGVDHAVVTGAEPVLRVGSSPDRRYAAALTRAYNDWLLRERLPSDDRLHGSVVVAPVAPAAAAEEIHRLGDRPDVVQVVLSGGTQVALGEERYWPIYEAAVEYDLPVAIHASAEGYGLANANTGAGYPSTYLEACSVTPANFMGQLLNLVVEGPFVKFPDLRVVMVGSGYSWVPSFLWRLDKMWKGLTDEMPWIERRPSRYVRDQVRFVTSRIDESGTPERTNRMLEMLHAEETLLFGSDYPHWDSFASGDSLPDLDPGLARAVFGGTATALYDL